MKMNMSISSIVYWRKNQFMTRLTYKGSVGRFTDEQLEILRTQDPVKKVLTGLDVDIDVQCIDVHQLPQPNPDGNSDFVFCHSINLKTQPQNDSGLMHDNGTTAGMGDQDHTLAVIKKINHRFNSSAQEGKFAALSEPFHTAFNAALGTATEGEQKETLPDDILFFNTVPRWLQAGTPDGTQGCPISPPIPVEKSSAPGRWKLQFSHLPDALQNTTGKGVKVFVLDTLPAPDQISWAAEKAGSSNMLLQEMTKGMRWEKPFNAVPPAINCKSQFLPEVGEESTSERIVTGKDIYGRHVGFNMADHGMFIAGIIRDLAPEADIECIRVLDDFGVGDICTLHDVLIEIYDRMSTGDLQDKPVVINLSLVVLPPEDDIPEEVTSDILESTRDALNRLLQCLVDQGAIFVAAAGNDSDPRMNASENRFGPRYPAALASDNHAMTAMISVGAVNRNKQAAKYSNYPGTHGIATYGGDVPKPDPWMPSAIDYVTAGVDTQNIDALCGVYTAAQHPALSKNDPESVYPVPNCNAWAYWSGTSFATPIISALAARVLQKRDHKDIDVRQVISDASRQYVMWTAIGEDGKDIPGHMIMAVQEWQSEETSSS